VDLLDMQAEGVRGTDIAPLVQERQPRVVGISTMVVTYGNALRVACLVKKALPTAKVVIGGPQATFLVEETLACLAVDVLVCYEGEETLVELMHHYDGDGPALEHIRGIAFRDGDRIHQTEQRPLITELDSLPFPSRHLFKASLYTKPGVLITARGCPSQCIFCAANALYPGKKRYRARSPQAVVDEIGELVEYYGVGEFFIADDAFTLQPERAMEICDLILARRIRTRWTCEARINSMTPELVYKMREAGCYLVQYGIETGNPEIMKLIRKGISLEQVEEVVNYTQAAGIDIICSFIIGFPWDTHQTVNQTIDFARQLCCKGAREPNLGGAGRGLVNAMFAHLTPLPGTYLYDHAGELGVRLLSQDWDRYTMSAPIIETSHLSVMDMRDLYIKAARSTLVTSGIANV
jgi:anaerobic magnesium-protoporphyrin IX monomethyl ester cyclase